MYPDYQRSSASLATRIVRNLRFGGVSVRAWWVIAFSIATSLEMLDPDWIVWQNVCLSVKFFCVVWFCGFLALKASFLWCFRGPDGQSSQPHSPPPPSCLRFLGAALVLLASLTTTLVYLVFLPFWSPECESEGYQQAESPWPPWLGISQATFPSHVRVKLSSLLVVVCVRFVIVSWVFGTSSWSWRLFVALLSCLSLMPIAVTIQLALDFLSGAELWCFAVFELFFLSSWVLPYGLLLVDRKVLDKLNRWQTTCCSWFLFLVFLLAELLHIPFFLVPINCFVKSVDFSDQLEIAVSFIGLLFLVSTAVYWSYGIAAAQVSKTMNRVPLSRTRHGENLHAHPTGNLKVGGAFAEIWASWFQFGRFSYQFDAQITSLEGYLTNFGVSIDDSRNKKFGVYHHQVQCLKLYTRELPSKVYPQLNHALRNDDADALADHAPYIRALSFALRYNNRQSEHDVIYRGVGFDDLDLVLAHTHVGDRFFWKPFSSCSYVEAEAIQFALYNWKPYRVLFVIDLRERESGPERGFSMILDLQELSHHDEKEVLLDCYQPFECMSWAEVHVNGLTHVIHLKLVKESLTERIEKLFG